MIVMEVMMMMMVVVLVMAGTRCCPLLSRGPNSRTMEFYFWSGRT